MCQVCNLEIQDHLWETTRGSITVGSSPWLKLLRTLKNCKKWNYRPPDAYKIKSPEEKKFYLKIKPLVPHVCPIYNVQPQKYARFSIFKKSKKLSHWSHLYCSTPTACPIFILVWSYELPARFSYLLVLCMLTWHLRMREHRRQLFPTVGKRYMTELWSYELATRKFFPKLRIASS